MVLTLVRMLEKALQKAELALKQQDDFLSMVSHELWTPITAIKLQLEMLKDKYAQGGIPVSGLTSIEKMAKREEKLVSSMLDIAMIEAGEITLRKEKCDLQKLITKAATSAQDVLENIDISYKLDPIFSNCDKPKIEKAIFNIIHNAIKYGDKKSVSISLYAENGNAVIIVSNTGTPIPKNHHSLIFEKLKRPMVPEQVQGIGVGLFLAKTFIEAHNGKIKIASDAPKTAFTVLLPLT